MLKTLTSAFWNNADGEMFFLHVVSMFWVILVSIGLAEQHALEPFDAFGLAIIMAALLSILLVVPVCFRWLDGREKPLATRVAWTLAGQSVVSALAGVLVFLIWSICT